MIGEEKELGVYIEAIEKGLRDALDRAERTRKRTGSSEDRDFVMLIRVVREAVLVLKEGNWKYA